MHGSRARLFQIENDDDDDDDNDDDDDDDGNDDKDDYRCTLVNIEARK